MVPCIPLESLLVVLEGCYSQSYLVSWRWCLQTYSSELVCLLSTYRHQADAKVCRAQALQNERPDWQPARLVREHRAAEL